MRFHFLFAPLLSGLLLTGCVHRASNPIDPYESFNRKAHHFNKFFDKALLKPTTRFYRFLIPALIRKRIDNAFNNVDMLPSIASDLLQAEGRWALKDSWRFIINSSLGIGGLFDVASTFGLPPHYNDLGITFAKWGDKKSPYLVIPFIGPSTIRDGAGWFFQFVLWTPYVYINNDALAYGLVGLRYIDLRSQLFDTEVLMNEALDEYVFIRDAYLQHRNFLIAGAEQETGAAYIEEVPSDQNAVNPTEAPAAYVE